MISWHNPNARHIETPKLLFSALKLRGSRNIVGHSVQDASRSIAKARKMTDSERLSAVLKRLTKARQVRSSQY